MTHGVIAVEQDLILFAIWFNQYYDVSGFLFLVSVIFMITCAASAVVLNYFRLCGENHNWWWHSFIHGGSAGFGVFLYSVFFYMQGLDFDTISWSSAYFVGFMGLVSS